METIFATAFGRVIDFQRGESDELSEAASTVASGLQSATSSLLTALLSKCL